MKEKEFKVGDMVQLKWDIFVQKPITIGIVVNVYRTKTGLKYYKVIWTGRKKVPVPQYLTANDIKILEI
jgi:hypothetical protein